MFVIIKGKKREEKKKNKRKKEKGIASIVKFGEYRRTEIIVGGLV